MILPTDPMVWKAIDLERRAKAALNEGVELYRVHRLVVVDWQRRQSDLIAAELEAALP